MYLATLKKSIVQLLQYKFTDTQSGTVLSIGGIDVLDASHLEELFILSSNMITQPSKFVW